jgi:hypothetical protein
MKWLAIMLMVALMAVAPGYGSAEQPGKKDTSPATQPNDLEVKGPQAQPAKKYTSKERQVYEKKTAADLEAIQQRIEGLQDKAAKAEPSMKRAIVRNMVNLQRMQIGARNQFGTLKKAPEKTWAGLKVDMDKTMDGLTKAIDGVEEHL